jgi:hypothetical protein
VNFPADDEPTLWYVADQHGINAIPRLMWWNGRAGVLHLRAPGVRPSDEIHFDDIAWRGPRTRKLEIN